MTRIITKGATDQSVRLYIVDNTTGLPVTSLAFNSSGIDLWYRREGAAVTSITEATQTASGAHSDGGFVHLANGVYRLDLPDAAVASGVDSVEVGGTFTGYNVYPTTIQLVAVNLQDTVRLGLTALPNAAAEASGGLYTRGTGAGQINQANNGQIDANAARTGGTTNTGRDIGANVLLSSGTGTGQLSLSSGLVTLAGVTHTGAVIPTVTTLTGHTAQTGDNYARIGSLGAGLTALATQASVNTIDDFIDTEIASIITSLATIAGYLDTEVAAIKAKTDNLPSDPADASDIATSFSSVASTLSTIAGYLDTEVAAIKSKTDNLPAAPASTGDVTTATSSLATAANLATVDTVVDAIKVVTDALTSAAAAKLALSGGQIIAGTVDSTVTPTTTAFEADDITEATADHYNGRVIIFTSGALAGQATSISDYALASGKGRFTCVALTEAPANNDTFIIV